MHPDLLSFVGIFGKDNEYTANVALKCVKNIVVESKKDYIKNSKLEMLRCECARLYFR